MSAVFLALSIMILFMGAMFMSIGVAFLSMGVLFLSLGGVLFVSRGSYSRAGRKNYMMLNRPSVAGAVLQTAS